MEALERHTAKKSSTDPASDDLGSVADFVQFVNQRIGKHFKCCICLSLFSDPVMLPCNHALCRACAAQALKESQRCPQCMVTIPNLRTLQGRNAWITEMVTSLRNCLNEVGASLTQHAPVPSIYQNARPPKSRARVRQRGAPGSSSGGRTPPPSPPHYVSCGGGGAAGTSEAGGGIKRKNTGAVGGERKSRKRPPPSRSSSTTTPPAAPRAARPQYSRGRSCERDVSGGGVSTRWERRTPSPQQQTRGGGSVWGFQASQPEDEDKPCGRPEMLAVTPSSMVTGAVDRVFAANGSDASLSLRNVPVVPPQPFVIGDLVFVDHRTWPGVNKHGGVALISAVLDPPGSRYDVKYSVSQSLDRGVEACYVHPYSFPTDSVGVRGRRGNSGGRETRGRRRNVDNGARGRDCSSASPAVVAATSLVPTPAATAPTCLPQTSRINHERQDLPGEKDKMNQRMTGSGSVAALHASPREGSPAQRKFDREVDRARKDTIEGVRAEDSALSDSGADGANHDRTSDKMKGSGLVVSGDGNGTDDEPVFDQERSNRTEPDKDYEEVGGEPEGHQDRRDKDRDETAGGTGYDNRPQPGSLNAAQLGVTVCTGDRPVAAPTVMPVSGGFDATVSGKKYDTPREHSSVRESLTQSTSPNIKEQDSVRNSERPVVSNTFDDAEHDQANNGNNSVGASHTEDSSAADVESGGNDNASIPAAADASAKAGTLLRRAPVLDSTSANVPPLPTVTSDDCLGSGVEPANGRQMTTAQDAANKKDGRADARTMRASARVGSPLQFECSQRPTEDFGNAFNLSADSALPSQASPPASRSSKVFAPSLPPPLPSTSSLESAHSATTCVGKPHTTFAGAREPLLTDRSSSPTFINFKVGDLVDVRPQTSPGLNKEGGVARVTRVDSTKGLYDVKYLVRTGTDKGVLAALLSRYDVGTGDENNFGGAIHASSAAAASGSTPRQRNGKYGATGEAVAGTSSTRRAQRSSKGACPPDAAAGQANAACLSYLLGDTQHPELLLDYDLGEDLDPTEDGSPARRTEKRNNTAATVAPTPSGGKVVCCSQGNVAVIRASGSRSDEGAKKVGNARGVANTGSVGCIRKRRTRKARTGGRKRKSRVCAEISDDNEADDSSEGFADEAVDGSEPGDSSVTSSVGLSDRQNGSAAGPTSAVTDVCQGEDKAAFVRERAQPLTASTGANDSESKQEMPVGGGDGADSASGSTTASAVSKKRRRASSKSPGAGASSACEPASQGERNSRRGRGSAKSSESMGGSRAASSGGQSLRRSRGGGVVLTTSNVTARIATLATEVAKSRGWKMEPHFSNDVTHVICTTDKETNKVTMRSIKFLRAVAAGKWIVNETWLQACKLRGSRVPEDSFEIAGDKKTQVPSAPTRSRLMHSDPSRPGLFHDTIFHFRGDVGTESPSRLDLGPMLLANGGVVAETLASLFSGSLTTIHDKQLGGQVVEKTDSAGSLRRIVIFQASASSPEEDTKLLARQLAALEKGRGWGGGDHRGGVEVVRPLWLVDSIAAFRALKPNALHRVALPVVDL